MHRIRVIDLETLFAEPQPNGIVEVGYTDVVSTGEDLLGGPTNWAVDIGAGFLLDPMQPIPPETSAIHHIIDEDVIGAPNWRDILPCVFGTEVCAYAAHGAKFEKEWISNEITGSTPWIDTYRCSLRLHPDAPSHSNNGMRYYLRPEGLQRNLAVPAHRAQPDSYVTAHLVRDFLNAGHSVAQLVKWSDEPALLPRCKIGKWRNDGKGTPWTEVDSGFLKWMLDKDFDEDTVFTARYHLDQREIDQRLEAERRMMNDQFRKNGLPETPPDIPPTPPLSAYEDQGLLL